VIDDGAIGFRDGTIDYVGYVYGVRQTYDTTLDAAGGHVYPGLILADATLGLHEIDLVRATADADETGELEPEVRALPAFNSTSRIIPTVRNNGVLVVQATPRGGVLSGTSSIMQLDAWNWKDAVVKADDGVHLNWPRAFVVHGWWAERGEVQKEKDEERDAHLRELDAFFSEAAAYARQEAKERMDLRMEAMKGLFLGGTTLFIHADRAREIQEAVLLARRHGVRRVVLVGGYDAWRVSDLLRDNDVDIILRRVHSLPLRDDDPVDLPYRLPALLKEKGLRFCLSYTGDMERMGSRNLAYTAGTAATYGLDREEALRAITLDAARVLGIDKDLGSLEVGKQATLFISRGDMLDMRSSDVSHAFISGRAIDLDDHQKALYRTHRQRLER
jgi:imidazolonepropionase-like amidohydrolase